MSAITKIIILGIIQGVTEFLPVSSSGHLVILSRIIGFKECNIFTEIVMHIGTSFSIIVFYKKELLNLLKDLMKMEKEAIKKIIFIFLAMIPCAIVYPVFNSILEKVFVSPVFVSLMLCITGLILLSTKFTKKLGDKRITSLNATVIGIAQAFALIPGISRSGIILSSAIYAGINITDAADFFLLLSIPTIFSAAIVEGFKAIKTNCITSDTITMLLIGGCVSFMAGYIAIQLSIQLFKTYKIWVFGIYCIITGLTATFYFYFFI